MKTRKKWKTAEKRPETTNSEIRIQGNVVLTIKGKLNPLSRTNTYFRFEVSSLEQIDFFESQFRCQYNKFQENQGFKYSFSRLIVHSE